MGGDRDRKIVAVDGGGSTCRACISDLDGTVLGRATGRAANVTTDFTGSRENILQTVALAYKDAGLSHDRLADDYAWLGLAGASIGDVAQRLQASLPFHRARVSTDRETTVQGAMGSGDGTVALLGTGSFFVARSRGVTRNVGGWGFQLCDDGGGAWLGLALLRHTVKAHDGLLDHSPLSRAILARHGGAIDRLVTFARAATPQEFAALAPELVLAFGAGDGIAKMVINQAIRRLQDTLENLGARQNGPLFLLGGLGAFYQDQLSAELRAICETAKGDALAGAIELAQTELVGAIA